MFVVEAYGYFILAAILALGGFAGWLSGWLLKLLIRVKRRPPLDTLWGALGSLSGVYISLRGFSVYEEWYDGKLISRHIGGWADHVLLFALVCSVGLATTIKTGAYIWGLTSKRSSNLSD